jgi:hypothetical protein
MFDIHRSGIEQGQNRARSKRLTLGQLMLPISRKSLFLKYLIRIDAIATDYLAPDQRRPTNVGADSTNGRPLDEGLIILEA